MSNIAALPGGHFTAAHVRAFQLMASMFGEAIMQAKDAGVPQGLIVSMLHGLAQRETTEMLDQAP